MDQKKKARVFFGAITELIDKVGILKGSLIQTKGKA